MTVIPAMRLSDASERRQQLTRGLQPKGSEATSHAVSAEVHAPETPDQRKARFLREWEALQAKRRSDTSMRWLDHITVAEPGCFHDDNAEHRLTKRELL